MAPMLVGLSGKRDLKGRDAAVARTLRQVFAALDAAFPGTPKELATGLAAGADLLACEVALERLGWRLLGVLPFEAAAFRATLGEAAPRFDAALATPRLRHLTLAPLHGLAPGLAADEGAYEQLGLWLAARCDVLLGVLPAQEPPGLPGGTARVMAHRVGVAPDAVAAAVLRASRELREAPVPRAALLLDLAGAEDAAGHLPLWLRRDGGDAPLSLAPAALRAALGLPTAGE
jgi:hypothetical protein